MLSISLISNKFSEIACLVYSCDISSYVYPDC
nr:MAG TPA: hypothetical protein [Caudoviricetes sp.]